MKQLKLMAMMLTVLILGACGDDDDGGNEVSDPVAPSVTAPTDGSSIVITESNLESDLEISWAAADFGVDVAVSYDIQLDVDGGDFSNAATLAAGVNGVSTTIAHSVLNSAVISTLEQEANTAVDLDLRVVASSQGLDDLTSGVIGLNVTSFKADVIVAPITTLSAATVAVTSETLSNELTISWSAATVGSGDTTIYTIAMSVAGAESSQTVAITGDLQTTLTHEALNFYLDQNLGQDPNTEVSVEFVVTATSGDESIAAEAVTAAITTLDAQYSGSDVMYMTGSFTDPGWEPWNNAVILHPFDNEGTTNYEGYAYFNAPHEVKFTDQAGWDGTNYAFDSDGVLTTTGTGNIPVDAGHYRVIVDPTNLTYSFTEVQWGVIGTATPGGWDASTAMTFNEDNNTWELTEDLVNGALKFRANDGWDINFGPRDSFTNRGELIHTDAAIDFGVTESGNYTVVISFDTSVSPYKWNFEVIRNQ